MTIVSLKGLLLITPVMKKAPLALAITTIIMVRIDAGALLMMTLQVIRERERRHEVMAVFCLRMTMYSSFF